LRSWHTPASRPNDALEPAAKDASPFEQPLDFVVLDDADVSKRLVQASSAGSCIRDKICMSTNRLIVESRVYDEFVDEFAALARQLKAGDPNDPEMVIGPVINKKQLDRWSAESPPERCSLRMSS
jgi:hypothetical protein